MKNQTLDAFTKGLKLLIESEGWKMKPLSEAAGMSETGVKDLFRYNSAPKVNNAYALALAMGRTVDDIIKIGMSGAVDEPGNPPSIAVPGQAGAGAEVFLCDDHAKGDGLYHVACPPQLSPHGIVAVEVKGDSMEPTYSEGDLLFYSRETADGVPTEAIGKKVVAETTDGRVWVKQLKLGSEPGLFHLLSLNPAGLNMHDVAVKWAAPVRLYLPKEFVKKVD